MFIFIMELKILKIKLDPFSITDSEDQVNRFLASRDVIHVNTVVLEGMIYIFFFYEE